MHKIVVAIVIVIISLNSVLAQYPGARTGGMPSGAQTNIGHFYGKIVDSKTNKAIDAMTVQLTGNKFDTVTKKMKEAILSTQITKANGDFSFENLSLFGNYKLKVSGLGVKTLEQPISFGIKMPQAGAAPNMQQMLSMADKDLGNIKVTAEATDLGNVTVTSSSKPQFEMGIDRKIFNVDKNLVSTGQSATEIMKNIPSVNVDIDGNVTLRNAAPTIFMDGRPTTLTLDQIPSDIIDRVELITNPSAKFDASGGNGGIINIVLKKNKKVGYNGGIRTGIDARGKINFGTDLNIRQNKINAFLSANVNQFKSIGNSLITRDNLFTTPSSIRTSANTINEGGFSFMRGGFDYFIDNRNTLSFAGNYNTGNFNTENNQRVDSTIKSAYTSYNQIGSGNESTSNSFGGQLSYKHNYAKNGESLSADFNYNERNSNNTSTVNTQTYFINNTFKGFPLKQQTLGSGNSSNITGQLDYENPIKEDSKLEMGARGSVRLNESVSNQYRYNNTTGKYEMLSNISNSFKSNDQVYAAYATYTFKVRKTSYQLGLRAESSSYTGTLLTTAGKDSASFKVQYPLSLIPTAFLTYKLTDKQDLQFNYARRINRANFWQLIPYPDFTDPQNISVGNPGIRPEFTNSFEFSYNNAYKQGANFLATAFFKYSTDLITRYVYTGKNQLNPADTTPVYYTSYINADNSVVFGLELSNKVPVTKWWDLTLSGNLFSSKINASIPGQNISNDAQVSWFAKMNSNFKINKTLSIQFSGDYQAKTILSPSVGGGGGRGGMGGGGGWGGMFGGGAQTSAQGYNLPRYGFDLAIRKDWTWKNGKSGSLTLSMNDIFRTQLYKSYSESSFFTQNSERRRDAQIARVNFNYRFGKFDAALFKRKNTKADQSGGGMDMMQ
jgi:outer membrane receptor protein involved in Fe transport